MGERVYRIQKEDGSFRGEGRGGGSNDGEKRLKTWHRPGDVRNHVKMSAAGGTAVHRMNPRQIADGAGCGSSDVVEYELREVKRTSVVDFLGEG
jgi:hypothetical protein